MMPEQSSHPLDRLCRTAAAARRSSEMLTADMGTAEGTAEGRTDGRTDLATVEPAVLAQITLACRTAQKCRVDQLDADWARTALRRTLLYAGGVALLAWAL